ncbi:MAG TPA: trypsin-like serine protease [Stellaceae bacterium]
MQVGKRFGPGILAAGLALLALGAAAEDRRVVVNPDQPPWTAIVKVQTNIGSRCTGVLIAPAEVLTAAHCLYNPRTQALLEPVSLHVLLGYQRGAYRAHRLVKRFAVGPGFAGPRGPPTSDWARLELNEAVPSAVAPLPLAGVAPSSGMPVSLAGYNQDRAQILLADPACHVTGSISRTDGTLIIHDCAATRGTSGAPLLFQHGGGWAVLGINLGAGRGSNLALGITGITP